jgi:hypothetical protein
VSRSARLSTGVLASAVCTVKATLDYVYDHAGPDEKTLKEELGKIRFQRTHQGQSEGKSSLGSFRISYRAKPSSRAFKMIHQNLQQCSESSVAYCDRHGVSRLWSKASRPSPRCLSASCLYTMYVTKSDSQNPITTPRLAKFRVDIEHPLNDTMDNLAASMCPVRQEL